MFSYTAFGLNIASQIEFPELVEQTSDGGIDVHIELGTTPETLEGATLCNTDLWVNSTQCLQHIDGVARYYAENGNKVIVEPFPGADARSMRIYLLCSTMAAIVHQRKLIPLHASGVLTGEGIALLIGDSGAGKSTTVKALADSGYRIFTDDVCVLESCEGTIIGIPSYPVMKLWESSFDLLRLGAADEKERLWKDVNKYGVSFHKKFVSMWKPVTSIFILEKADQEAADLTELRGIEAFIAIGSNTYRGAYVPAMSLNALHFDIVNGLINQCQVFKIRRPSIGNSISEVIELIKNDLGPQA